MRNYLVAAACFIGLLNYGLSQVDLSPLRAYADSRAQQIDNEINMHGHISDEDDQRARALLRNELVRVRAQGLPRDCGAYLASLEQELAFKGKISSTAAVQLKHAKQFRNCQLSGPLGE